MDRVWMPGCAQKSRVRGVASGYSIIKCGLLAFLALCVFGVTAPTTASAKKAKAGAKKKRRSKKRSKRRRRRRARVAPKARVEPAAPAKPVDPLAAYRNRTLIIATKSSPPFSMKEGNGRWTGISIELWREVATALNLKFKFKEMTLPDMLKATREGKADAAVASLTITPNREEHLDFTHSFYSTGLGIAVHAKQSKGQFLGIVKKFFSWQYIRFFLIFFLLLWITGSLVWFFERRANPDEFGGKASHGLGAGFWWSVVTMTTVGYGDKSPRTFFGRLVAVFWIFAGLILVSTFTATLTTLLTVNQLESGIKGPKDLYKMRVATVDLSTSMRYLQRRRIKLIRHKSVYDGMRAVADKKADAMVYDAPLLRYIATHQLTGMVRVLPGVFERQDYGIALPEKSPLREPVNRVLLRFIYSARWDGMIRRYMGK